MNNPGAIGGANATAAATAAAQQQAIQAQRTMGPIVTVEPYVWLDLAVTSASRVAVHATAGGKMWVPLKHRYLIAAHGLFFTTTHTQPLNLPQDIVVIESKSIHIP